VLSSVSWSAARNSEGLLSVCGWVNAKNAFGGYTGMQPFVGFIMIMEDGRFRFEIGHDEKNAAIILDACKSRGLLLLE